MLLLEKAHLTPVWSRSMLFNVIMEDIDTTIMDNGFENSDMFERKWHEFVNKYSEVKLDLVMVEQRRIMIRNRIINMGRNGRNN
jgi:hypothetical protein